MPSETIKIGMSSFGDFVACDPMGQLAKVREIRRQYESDYFPGGDFWSRFREGLEELLRDGGSPTDLDQIHKQAKNNRSGQYASACKGFERFWGRHRLDLLATPKPASWNHGRLKVRVNPEMLLEIDGKPIVLKLHLKERVALNQRLANPLLHLLRQEFGDAVKGGRVGILEVHKGKLWIPGRARQDFDAVLRMQAASFVAGWDLAASRQSAA